MGKTGKNNLSISGTGNRNPIGLIVISIFLCLIVISLGVFIRSVQEWAEAPGALPSTQTPLTIPTRSPTTTNVPPTETPTTYPVFELHIQTASIVQNCFYNSYGQYLCVSYLNTGFPTNPPTATPSATSTPTNTSTPTATATTTPTSTSTPTLTILELPQTRAGLSFLSILCLTGLLIGLLISRSVWRSKP